MPRMLAPRNDSLSRRNSRGSNVSSLRGSKSSFNSFASATSRRKSLSNNLNVSQFSLGQSALQNGSAQSSMHSLRRQKSSRQNALSDYIQEKDPSKQNATWNHTQEPSKRNKLWNIAKQGFGSQGPPSLISSESSVTTEGSSQSSLQPPVNDAHNDFLNIYALHESSMQQQTNTPVGSPRNYGVGRVSLQRPTILHPTNSLRGSRRNSFHPYAQIKEEDTWGQFVETADAEEELVRRCRVLSTRRRYPASSSHSSPAQWT